MRSVAILGFTFILGFSIVYSTNKKFQFLANQYAHQLQRYPSAIRQNYDFTNLRGSALDIAMRERIIGNMEIVRTPGGNEIGLSLGHFAFKSENGESSMGCQYFSKVTLYFEAEGNATSGEKSIMEVEGPCRSTEDLAKIEANLIPIKKLMQEQPVDGDIQISEKKLGLKFLNLTDSWPTLWNLVGVKLTAPQKEFIIDRNEILKIIGQPVFVSTNE